MVEDDHRSHRLDDGDGAGQDARVVAAARLHQRGIAFGVHRLLRAEERGDGLEGDAEVDVLALSLIHI